MPSLTPRAAAATTQHSPRIRLGLATQLKDSQLQDLSPPELQAVGANRIGSEAAGAHWMVVMGDRGRRRVKSSPTSPRAFQSLQSSVRSSAAWIASLRFPLLVQSGRQRSGRGPRTPPQAHSACLQGRVTHCSPGPELPFLVLSTTHPHPQLRVL